MLFATSGGEKENTPLHKVDKTQFIYIVFSVLVIAALVFDLGLLSKKNTIISLRTALLQTAFWVSLSFLFSAFIGYEKGSSDAITYISAYLLEWSLSIDNIFVFIIIFSFFRVRPHNYSRVLLLGIIMAVVFRIIFIAIGTTLVAHFDWIMYLFGVFLIYTGIKLFVQGDEEDFDPGKNWAYRLVKRFIPTVDEESTGRFIIIKNRRTYFTRLAVVVLMLGLTDIVFAVDSIPAVFSIIPDPGKKLLIYSSNIFAVLGLRSLFFLLREAADRFDFLQKGIAVVLLFIGTKMLVEKWIYIPVWVSLLVIVICISFSIIISAYGQKKKGTKTVGKKKGAE